MVNATLTISIELGVIKEASARMPAPYQETSVDSPQPQALAR
jgi:hypothetical protein